MWLRVAHRSKCHKQILRSDSTCGGRDQQRFHCTLQDEADSSDEERDAPAPAEMEGLRVAHSAEDLGVGETVILTLKDRNILEEGDDDPEELENVLAVRKSDSTFHHRSF